MTEGLWSGFNFVDFARIALRDVAVGVIIPSLLGQCDE